MPCVQIKTNTAVNAEKAEKIKSELGKIITFLPEKTEPWLMVTLQDDCRIWFHGETGRPMAIVEVKVFGNKIDSEGSKKMTKAFCALFEQELGVDPQDIYIRYLASMDCGWNNENF